MNKRRILKLLVISIAVFLLTGCFKNSKVAIAFTHVNLIPMSTEQIISDQTVLIYGSYIVGIGNSDEIKIPEDAEVINGNGAYLMPGLADMHMHTRADWEDPKVWPVNPLFLYLANGVTTIRDFSPYGSPIDYALQWRKEISDGKRIGPTIYSSGELLYASPLEDPAGIVDRNYDKGFDFLKVYSFLSREDFHQAIAEAELLGMYTAGHIPYAVGLDGVLSEGMDEIAHVEELLFEFIHFDRNRQLSSEEWMSYIAESAILQFGQVISAENSDFFDENEESLQKIAKNLESKDIPISTTMVIDDIIQLKLFRPEEFFSRYENQYLESGYIESFQRGEEKHQRQCKDAEALCAYKYVIDCWILKGLHTEDILLILGTDSGTGGMGIIPGFSVHDELHILVENGFTNYEALKTATVNPAIVVERMIGEGNFGTIDVGNRADLILVAKNPLEGIETLRTPLGVMAGGKWFSLETLNQLIELPEF